MGTARSVCAWVLVACSQATTPPYLPDTTDGGDSGKPVGGDAAYDAPAVCRMDDAGCTMIQNCGAKVYIVWNASNPPTGTGGTVADGTYTMTDYTVFTGTGGPSGQQPAWFSETMVFATEVADASAPDGGTLQQMTWSETSMTSGATNDTSATGTAYFASPNALTIDSACPSNSAPFVSTYSASSTQLLLYVGDPKGTGQITFTKH